MDFNIKMLTRPRTAGDGMESENLTSETSKNERTHTENIYPKVFSPSSSMHPGRLVQVYPTSITRKEKQSPLLASKATKFVPYEPYPAAVKPIVPKQVKKGTKRSNSKNNMDINILISQMSQMDTELNVFKPRSKHTSVSERGMVEEVTSSPETEAMQSKINLLTDENMMLKEQLKQQVQVNKELKTMLVASMGEDLETQVQSLNEDKKHLADALLNSAQHLSTHQEQTEWLAGQCEVWRSKFLASSLMVEELANWKRLLNERTEELRQAVKQLLDEKCRTRDMMLCTYKNLYSLHKQWLNSISIDYEDEKIYSKPLGNVSAPIPHTTNMIDLASINLKISQNLSCGSEEQDMSMIASLPIETDAEKFAENIMALPLELKKVNEDPVKALVDHAYNKSGNTQIPVASCSHCSGKVQLL